VGEIHFFFPLKSFNHLNPDRRGKKGGEDERPGSSHTQKKKKGGEGKEGKNFSLTPQK